jgi:sugar/nucleoside kinase (ribokinase family)
MHTFSHIHVLGDLNLDIVLSGIVDLPVLGTERVARDCVVKPGGSAANVAIMLARNRCPVRLFSQTGNDEAGNFLLKQLERFGLHTDTISLSPSASTGLTISLTYPEDRIYITYPGSVAKTKKADLKDGYIDKGAHLHLSSFFLQSSLQKDIGSLLRDASAAGMSTSLDPGSDTVESWDVSELIDNFKFLDYFMPSSDEICALTGTRNVHDALDVFPREARVVVVKAGVHGAVTRRRGTIEHHAAIPVDAVDSTCAGDCFDAGFLFGLYQGKSFQEAVQRGIEFGAQAVSTLGLPSEGIDDFLKELT